MIVRTLVSISAVLAAASAASAQSGDSRSEVVTVRPFEFADPAAREELQLRIENAIESVCRNSGRRDLASLNTQRRCESETLERVEAQLGFALAELDGQRIDRQLALHVAAH